jgi:CheY-like chemotaxis protein
VTSRCIVCVVCASSVTRALFTSLLGSAGTDVHPFDALPRALSGMVGVVPDVVVLDAQMARANPETIGRLREAWHEPVGIVLADRAFVDERRGATEARALGADCYVAIPPDPGALAEAVRRALGHSSRGAISAAAPSIPSDVESSPPVDAEQMSRYVARLFARLDSLDAYQILRVSTGATIDEIRDAFRERALEFHPDRLHPGLDEAARERIYQIFKRVSWAFRKVGEAKARREYDASRTRKPA